MATGTVVRLIRDRGFGFIRLDDGSEVFFHHSSMPPGDFDQLHENEQVEEVWTGTTFAIASHMLSEGMRDQAFHTARGVYNVVWKDRGYFFRTPEAYDAQGMYRASMYMRPGAIWSMELAPK